MTHGQRGAAPRLRDREGIRQFPIRSGLNCRLSSRRRKGSGDRPTAGHYLNNGIDRKKLISTHRLGPASS